MNNEEFNARLVDIQARRDQLLEWLTHLYRTTGLYIEEIRAKDAQDVNTFIPELLHQQKQVLHLLSSFSKLEHWYWETLERTIASTPELSEHEVLYYRNRALDNIMDEFAIIMNLSNETRMNDTIFGLNFIESFINDVGRSLGLNENISDSRLLIHLSRDFYINHYHYAPQVISIGIPRSMIHTPWKWSMIWHELASIIVYHRDEKSLFPKPHLQKFIADLCQKIEEIKLSISLEKWVPQVLGLDQTPNALKKIIEDWIQELIEDSCLILILGETGFQSLVDMLEGSYKTWTIIESDFRHPPAFLRVECAFELLNQTKGSQSVEQAKQRVEQIRSEVTQPTDNFTKIAQLFVDDFAITFPDGRDLINAQYLWSQAKPLHARDIFKQAYHSSKTIKDKEELEKLYVNLFEKPDKQILAEKIQARIGELNEQLSKRIMDNFEEEYFLIRSISSEDKSITLDNLLKLKFGFIDPWRQLSIRIP